MKWIETSEYLINLSEVTHVAKTVGPSGAIIAKIYMNGEIESSKQRAPIQLNEPDTTLFLKALRSLLDSHSDEIPDSR